MDKKWIIAAFIAIFALSSCLEKEVYQGPEEDEKEFNYPKINEIKFGCCYKCINVWRIKK